MRVLALIARPGHVCYRYRIAAFRAAIEQAGGTLCAASLGGGWLARMAALRAAQSADVVILQRRLLPRWELSLLRRWSRALVFDFDDAVFHRSSFSPRGVTNRRRARAFEATVRAAELTIAGNTFLSEQARRAVDENRVRIIPTCIDVEEYRAAHHQRTGGDTRLVWIGQRSTLRYLGGAKPCLSATASRVPGVHLAVIADCFEIDCGIPIVPRPWSADTEAAELADADIGISWLSDDDWSRGKCGLKVLQYMAAGLPVVANRVGANCEMVIDGQTGFLADTPDEWGSAVERLARDPALRARMGAAGRQMAAERYGVPHWGPKFVAVLQQLCRYEVSLTRVRLPSTAPADFRNVLTRDEAPHQSLQESPAAVHELKSD